MKRPLRFLALVALALPGAAQAQDRTGTLIAYIDAFQCDQITTGTFGIRAGRDDVVLRAHVVVGYRNNRTGANSYRAHAQPLVVQRMDRGDKIAPLSKIPIFAFTNGAPNTTTLLDVFRPGHTVRFVRFLISANEIDTGSDPYDWFADFRNSRSPRRFNFDWARHDAALNVPTSRPADGSGFLHGQFGNLGRQHDFLGGNEWFFSGDFLSRMSAPSANQLRSAAQWLRDEIPRSGSRSTFGLDFRGHGGRYSGTWRLVFAERHVVDQTLIVNSR